MQSSFQHLALHADMDNIACVHASWCKSNHGVLIRHEIGIQAIKACLSNTKLIEKHVWQEAQLLKVA